MWSKNVKHLLEKVIWKPKYLTAICSYILVVVKCLIIISYLTLFIVRYETVSSTVIQKHSLDKGCLGKQKEGTTLDNEERYNKVH